VTNAAGCLDVTTRRHLHALSSGSPNSARRLLSVTKRISLCVRCSRANSPVHQFSNAVGHWPSPSAAHLGGQVAALCDSRQREVHQLTPKAHCHHRQYRSLKSTGPTGMTKTNDPGFTAWADGGGREPAGNCAIRTGGSGWRQRGCVQTALGKQAG
jgi:hypothetical protein